MVSERVFACWTKFVYTSFIHLSKSVRAISFFLADVLHMDVGKAGATNFYGLEA